jgi:hypothetical protein
MSLPIGPDPCDVAQRHEISFDLMAVNYQIAARFADESPPRIEPRDSFRSGLHVKTNKTGAPLASRSLCFFEQKLRKSQAMKLGIDRHTSQARGSLDPSTGFSHAGPNDRGSPYDTVAELQYDNPPLLTPRFDILKLDYALFRRGNMRKFFSVCFDESFHEQIADLVIIRRQSGSESDEVENVPRALGSPVRRFEFFLLHSDHR